jgi:hypothetical protein
MYPDGLIGNFLLFGYSSTVLAGPDRGQTF